MSSSIGAAVPVLLQLFLCSLHLSFSFACITLFQFWVLCHLYVAFLDSFDKFLIVLWVCPVRLELARGRYKLPDPEHLAMHWLNTRVCVPLHFLILPLVGFQRYQCTLSSCKWQPVTSGTPPVPCKCK